jgi:dihydrofolate synthase/folylpolyglutamate synthase
VDVSDAAVRTGLTDARWPGRLERVRWRSADVLLDAAHNPAGARALAAYLRDAGWRDVTLVFGAMRDKDADGMISALLPSCELVICTTASSPRARSAGDLSTHVARLAAGRCRVETIDDPAAAMARACRAGSRVVVTGSIFLIGPLRDILR